MLLKVFKLFLRDSEEEACTGLVGDPERYVTRVVIREPNGTLTPVYPNCSDPITGVAESDPEYPTLSMFVLRMPPHDGRH